VPIWEMIKRKKGSKGFDTDFDTVADTRNAIENDTSDIARK
jgi:hypothetical protein